ncbi:putative NXPE family member 3-like isoform X2, partial [Apostichopus japonicus]
TSVFRNQVTSFSTFNRSLVQIVNPRTVYRVSEQVIIRIEARTANGSIQPFGGDFLRMKLFSKKPYSAIGPDTFIDYDNGTYLASFTLRWQGIVNVSVQLVHPRCVIDTLKGITQAGIVESFVFIGRFEKQRQNGTSYVEKVQCGLQPRQIPFCNLSANHTHGPWFCNKPENSSISCRDWTHFNFDASKSTKKLKKLITPKEYKALLRSNGNFNSGFFHKGTWQPFDCRLTHFESEQVQSCLNFKSMYFYGDSTARQMYEYIIQKKINCVDNGNKWMRHCTGQNTTMLFKFHGPPVRKGTPGSVRELGYIADEIDNNQEGGPGVYIILSLWAHLVYPDKTFYRDRLLSVKSAIDRLLERRPETRIIVRSANIREHSIGAFLLVSSDWVALQGERILRDVFSKDERISFLDVWDMTLVQECPDNVHPRETTLIQMLDYLLTMICQ